MQASFATNSWLHGLKHHPTRASATKRNYLLHHQSPSSVIAQLLMGAHRAAEHGNQTQQANHFTPELQL